MYTERKHERNLVWAKNRLDCLQCDILGGVLDGFCGQPISALNLGYVTINVPYKHKKVGKVQNFFRHFRTEVLRIPAFFLPPKTGVFVSAKDRRQLWYTTPHSCMLQKAHRKLAELKTKDLFFFFGYQHKIREKDASVSVMTFFLGGSH